SFEELAGKNPIYYESKLPQSLNHRYLIEDIPYGLIPMLSILEKFNGQFSSIKSVINMANVLTGCNYYEQARTLESLSLQAKLNIVTNIINNKYKKDGNPCVKNYIFQFY